MAYRTPGILAAALTALAVTATAVAQQPPQLAPTVVRVLLVRPGTRDTAVLATGNLQRLTSDTVTVVSTSIAQPGPHTIALNDANRLEVRMQRRSYAVHGAFFGALAGAIAGYLIASAAWTPCTQTGPFACMFYPTRDEQGGYGLVVGLAGGAGLGAIVGSTIHHDTWAPLAVPKRGAVALGLSVRF